MTLAPGADSSPGRTPRSPPLFDRVAIIGVGLIGGSVGLACRARGLANEIRGADPDTEHRKAAMALGCADEVVADAGDAVEGADLVVLATPVGAIGRALEQILPHLASAAVVTDVGSVKAPVAAAMDRLVPGGRGVPGHPIAGRERSGPAAASADLFVGARCVLTPTPATGSAAVRLVRDLWKGLGAEVVEMSPERHDQVFAAVSHLPHIVAYALMGAILDLADDGDKVQQFAAGGLRDFTRVAMSHPVMWRDICLANRSQILEMIERFQTALDQLVALIRAEDGDGLCRQFSRARTARESVGRSEEGGPSHATS